MTEDHTPDDATDAQAPTQPARRDPTTRQDSNDGIGRRDFLKKAAAAGIAATTGLTAVSDSAEAAQNRVTVEAKASHRMYYEIHMEGSNQSTGRPNIDYGPNIESSETPPDRIDIEDEGVGRNRDHVVASGHVENGNFLSKDHRDVYTYTGEIDYVVVDGYIHFQFEDSPFLAADESTATVYVEGLGSGYHRYNVTESNGDYTHGAIRDTGRDSYEFQEIQEIGVYGHARVWARFES